MADHLRYRARPRYDPAVTRPGVSYRARVGGLAAGGVVVAHWLTYAVATPDQGERHDLLQATGHTAWPYVVALALGAFAAWTAGFVRAGLHGRPTPRLRATALRLAGLQAAGWLALEASERVLFGHGDGHWHLVALGLAVQLVVAVAGATLCRATARVLARIGTRPRSTRRRAFLPPLRTAPVPLASGVATGGRGLRGPPRPSTA